MFCCCSLVAIAAAFFLAYFALQWTKRKQVVAELEAKVVRRRAEREEHVEWAKRAAEEGCSEEKREEIGKLDFDQLLAVTQNGTYTCVEVVAAYLGLSLKAHQRTNCVTLYIKECIEWAREWDMKAKEPGFQKPALFGIPISIKECTPVKGYDSTRGYVTAAFKPVKADSQMVEHTKQLGGIPFVMTNVPLSLLAYTCGNSLYGWTSHPLDASRTPGGSSGGEAAILAAGGSILGIGGDVGGSIRMPCHFTGTAGIKPCHLRLSSKGLVGSVPGRPLINASTGPMAQSISACVAMLRGMWKDDFICSRDPYVPPVKWNDEDFQAGRKYTIGYYTDDGWFTPTPGCVRAVEEAKALLEKKGHRVIPFSPPGVPEAVRLFTSCVCVDGGAYLLGNIMNDLPPAEYSEGLRLLRLPLRVQRLIGFIASLFGWTRIARFCRSMALSTAELRENYAAIEVYRESFADAMKAAGIDALLCPVQVMPAPPHATPLRLSSAVSYTALFNLLDFAAGVVRVTEWNEEDERRLADYPQSDIWYKEVKHAVKGSVGLPLGAQIAAPPFKEELVLRILLDLEDSRGGK